MRDNHKLDFLFKPCGCAILGASRDETKAGRQIMENMLASGFLESDGECGKRSLYLVNSREEGDFKGIKFYKTLSEIEGTTELVILAVSSNRIKEVLDDLDERMNAKGDVRAIITVAAGFAETGTDDGRERQRMLMECCKKHDIRVLGPNCVGIIDNANHLDSSFILGTSRKKGGISLISQSGAVGSWLLMDWASRNPQVGLNKFISLGNMSDIDTMDCLEYLAKDNDTSVIGIYMEGYPKARQLMEMAAKVTKTKPVLVLKVGRTELGGKAAHSHTGSMAGSDKVYDAAFRQFGILRVDTIEEFSDSLYAFDTMPLLESNRIFIITQAGGPGIYCIDSLENPEKFKFADISEESRKKLREVLPPFASICNPPGHVDLTAAANAKQHREAVEIVLSDENVDAVILITVPTLFVPARDIALSLREGIADFRLRGGNKPFLPVILSGKSVAEGRTLLEEGGITTFDTPDRAARVLRQFVRYSHYVKEGVLW